MQAPFLLRDHAGTLFTPHSLERRNGCRFVAHAQRLFRSAQAARHEFEGERPVFHCLVTVGDDCAPMAAIK
jgi:hypothetical protein